MRRPLFMMPAPTALAALAAVAALGCEDGPTQTYSPSPPNAGSIWNNGNVAPASTDAGQSFEAGYPVESKVVLCDTDFKRQRWAWMLTQPIQPPRKYAGIDLAGDDLWDGLTIGAAEAQPATPTSITGGLCQSVPQGYEGTCPSGFGGCNGNYWGNNAEVSFSWNVATFLIDQMVLNLGYTGQMVTNPYPDHTGAMHSWTVTIGDVIRRDGEPFEMNWPGTNINQQITDIYNGVMATYATSAGVPFEMTDCTQDSDCVAQNSVCQCDKKAGTTTCSGAASKCGDANCQADGNCLVYNDGVNTIFGIRPMVVYVEGNSGIPQPALSEPTLIYNFFSKWEPFSNLPQVVKLDAEGPVASGTPVGVPAGGTTHCTQMIGQTFGDFTTNCVKVTGNTATDTVNYSKVTHGLTHDQEHWTANVLGVNQNFTSLSVANNPDIVVQDTDAPQMGDLAQDWTFDVRARGAVSNDYGACAADTDCVNYGATSKCTPDTGTGISYCSNGDIHIPGPQPTLQGTDLVYIEWARLMLNDIARITGKAPRTLGDPACTGFTGGVPNYQLPANAKLGCSGIEGMIIPNAASTYGTVTPNFLNEPGVSCPNPAGTYNPPPCLDPGANVDHVGYFVSILKPGGAIGEFCIDPGPQTDCSFNTGYSLWQMALQQVIRVMGAGDELSLPVELQDRRYYFKWFGIAYVKYLKAFGNYAAKYGPNAAHFPNGTVGGGLGPTDVMNQQIDLESLFFDNYTQAGTFDKFEYIDRDSIGTGSGGAYNFIPWDFSYGCDLFGGNQRYDDWYRRMDREEIAMFASMLTDKTHTAGQENNVNITNLFGSTILGGNAAANVGGLWPSYACAIGQAGDPAQNCQQPLVLDTANIAYLIGNAPLDTSNPSGLAACLPDGSCADATKVCGGGYSFVNGYYTACGTPCDFSGANPKIPVATGCQSPTQTCAYNLHTQQEACLDMLMDKNGPNAATPKPFLSYYPGAWSQTPFSAGHSPITLAAMDKHPDIGVAKITIPNYANGPYIQSPMAASAGKCPTGYTLSMNQVWCTPTLNAGTSCDVVNPPNPPGSAGCNAAPSFTPLTPWLEVQPAVGFPIPLDAQHSQWVATGQFDFTGVLETYIVDYLPWSDPLKSSCIADGVCNAGYACDPVSHNCYTDTTDNTIRIAAIEGQDFLGQAFLCYDPLTFDVLHVGMYDTALSITAWLAAHPGGSNGFGVQPSAQSACQMLIIQSPYDNYIDTVVSKSYGVNLNISGGQGQGRVTDIVVFDPSLIQAL